MTEYIQEKLKELKEIFPNNAEFIKWMQQSDLWNWIYTVMKIRGEKIHKTTVVNLVEGNLVDDIPLSLYPFAQSCFEMHQDMNRYIGMQTDLEVRMILRWAKLLLGLDSDTDDRDVVRKNRNVVYEWDHIPCSEDEVWDGLAEIVKVYNDTYESKDPLQRVVDLHLRLNRLYAFGDDTTLVSMAVLMFSLLEMGLPVPALSVDDREYNIMMTEYIETGNKEPFKSMLERSVIDRLAAIISFARQAKESGY